MTTFSLIDLSSIWWQQWHASGDLAVGEAAHKTLDKVHRCASGADYVAVCCDAPPYGRRELLPEYKAQRDKHPAVALEQLDRVKEALRKRYHLFEAEGYEADDIIASMLESGSIELRPGHSEAIIHTSDKDLLQLVGPEVFMRSVQTGELYGPDEVVAKFGVTPVQMVDFLALCGDQADNIPGVPGIGPKKAAALLAEHDNCDAIDIAAREGMVPGKLGEALQKHAQAVSLARQLIALDTTAPVDVAKIFKEVEVPAEELIAEVMDASDATVDTQEESPAPVAAPQSQAIVAAAPNWNLALEPSNSSGAIKLARMMHESRMFGNNWPNEYAILSVILRGRELGLGASTALSNFHVVEGRPVMHAYLILGLVLKNPLCEYMEFTESTGQIATWVTKRKGSQREQTLTYTIHDVFAAGLVKKGDGPDGYVGIPTRNGKPSNWDKHRTDMLRKTCGVKLARAAYPDITAGLYCEEEF